MPTNRTFLVLPGYWLTVPFFLPPGPGQVLHRHTHTRTRTRTPHMHTLTHSHTLTVGNLLRAFTELHKEVLGQPRPTTTESFTQRHQNVIPSSLCSSLLLSPPLVAAPAPEAAIEEGQPYWRFPSFFIVKEK